MTSSWRWFIHPETAISMNRNGSRTLCVFKVHYRDHRAAVGNHRRFTQIQFSDHTGEGLEPGDSDVRCAVAERAEAAQRSRDSGGKLSGSWKAPVCGSR